MNKRREHRMRNGLVFLPFLFLIFCFVHCSDDNDSQSVYDPSKPVEFTTFSPDTGGVGTQLIIEGSNFGSDTALVRVSVNGKNARVIGVNDTRIYALVPSRADTGAVEVSIGPAEAPKTHTFENEFKYFFRQNVTTIAGQVDANGDGAYIDGNINEAWFREPYWLRFDTDGTLFIVECSDGDRNGGLRILENGLVSNPFRKRGGISRVRTIDFNLAQDTLFLTNDGGSNDVGTVFFKRSDGFMTFRAYIYSPQCNFGYVHPITGEYFYNVFGDGQIFRWNPEKGEGEYMFTTRDRDMEQHMCFSPDGRTAYIAVRNKHYIVKVPYDYTTGTFGTVEDFAGVYDQSGFEDGLGSDARFKYPTQIVFDDEQNLYVADTENHCIRKITPAGVVSTYAGIPKEKGWADGEPLKALFNQPEGLAFGPDGGLYVADRYNHRIRKIMVE